MEPVISDQLTLVVSPQKKRHETLPFLYIAGQIIATSHDLTPNGGLVREIPLFQGNLGPVDEKL